jgi:hypothetical protein
MRQCELDRASLRNLFDAKLSLKVAFDVRPILRIIHPFNFKLARNVITIIRDGNKRWGSNDRIVGGVANQSRQIQIAWNCPQQRPVRVPCNRRVFESMTSGAV